MSASAQLRALVVHVVALSGRDDLGLSTSVGSGEVQVSEGAEQACWSSR